MLETDELQESLRVYKVGFDVAWEQLDKATQEVKIWQEQTYMAEQQREVQEHNMKVVTRLLVDRDGGFRQEQARERERSRGALRHRMADIDARQKSLGHLRVSRFSKTVLETPPGSMSGSSSGAAADPTPKKEKDAKEREIDWIEELLCEMLDTTEQCVVEKSGASVLGESAYPFRCTATMTRGTGS